MLAAATGVVCIAAALEDDDEAAAGEDPNAKVLELLLRQGAQAKAATGVSAVTARSRLPARPLPKGGWACSASNDNLPSLVLDRSADGNSLPAHAH